MTSPDRMKILLVDTGTKLPSLALMRLSTWHKNQGDNVTLMNFGDAAPNPADFDKVYVSVIFTRDRAAVEQFNTFYGSKVQVGGPGWDLTTRLPAHVESCVPDWDLYTAEILFPRIKGPYSRETRMEKAQMIVDSGLGRLSLGCNRACSHCRASKMEGKLREASQFADIVNPRSNVVHLLDNSFGNFSKAIERLQEAKERGLVLNLSQGIDVRSASPEFLAALVEADLWGDAIYIAWDRIQDKRSVLAGISRLKPLADAHKKNLTCFVLTGFDTTFAQDQHRVETLHSLGIRPYVMPYEQTDKVDVRMAKFKRFVNAFFFKRMDFEDYEPWQKAQATMQQNLFAGA